MSLSWTTRTAQRFDAITRRVAARGRGIAPKELAAAAALAEELEKDPRDPEKIAALAERLGVVAGHGSTNKAAPGREERPW